MATPTPPVGVIGSILGQVWSDTQSGISNLVPDPYMVAINNHNYLHDLEFKPWKRQAMRATTVATTRTQADTSNEPGEQSLSTESLWRRTQDSWHLGAGQVYLDRKGSSEFSFRSSKGIDPWTQWQLGLLKDTSSVLLSANTNLALTVCGSHVYLIDGQALKFSSGNLASWTTVTGTPAATPSSICSDGHNVYVAYAASGLYTTTEGAASATQLVTSALAANSVVRFVMGRLMVAGSAAQPNYLYNIVSQTPAALPASPLTTSLFPSLVWTDLTNGNGVIFAAANSGNQGIIFSIQIQPDGTALSAPIVCGQLPFGETVNAIYGYAGSGVAIGTNLGWRFSEQSLANGVAGTVALTIGPVTLTPSPVMSFSGYNRFIWGTYQNYDATSTGLFRMDPSQFVSDLAPAFASDLMATTQGVVNSVVHLAGVPVFAVAGVGVYTQIATYVPSGTIDSGYITYGIADDKMPVFVDVALLPIANTSIQTLVSLNGGPFTNCGIYSQIHPFIEFATPQALSQTIEIRQVLTAGSSNTVSPLVTRHTLRAIPAPAAPTDWFVVIQLRDMVLIKGVEVPMVPSAEYAYLDALRIGKTISTLQVGNYGPLTVTVENIDLIPEQWSSVDGELNGVCVVNCRTVI